MGGNLVVPPSVHAVANTATFLFKATCEYDKTQLHHCQKLSASSRLCPLILWTPLGLLPQTPVIGSHYRSRYAPRPSSFCIRQW